MALCEYGPVFLSLPLFVMSISKRFATIDIGAHTIRLLIAGVRFNRAVNDYRIDEVYSERIISRLGEGVSETGRIGRNAEHRTIKALKKFSDIINRYQVDDMYAAATSALRDAANSDIFLKKVLRETGIHVNIISGEEEAKVTASGMMVGISTPERSLMLDIGGGSTELIFARGRSTSYIRSIPLGVVYLADTYIRDDPPSEKQLALMKQEICGHIDPEISSFSGRISGDTVMIGTAGTVTALAAMHLKLKTFDHDRVHNTTLSKGAIREMFATLCTSTSQKRASLLPFEPERLDIIVPGTFILLRLMDAFGFQDVLISNYGLREGILLYLYGLHGKTGLA